MGRPLPAARRQPDDLDQGADDDQGDGGDEQDGRDDVGGRQVVADDGRGRWYDGEDRGDATRQQPGGKWVVGDVATLAPADGEEDDPDDRDDVHGHAGEALGHPDGVGRAASELQRVRPGGLRPSSGERVEDQHGDGETGDGHHGPQPAIRPPRRREQRQEDEGGQDAAAEQPRPRGCLGQRVPADGRPLGGGVGVVLEGERRHQGHGPDHEERARRAGGGPGARPGRLRRAGRPGRGSARPAATSSPRARGRRSSAAARSRSRRRSRRPRGRPRPTTVAASPRRQGRRHLAPLVPLACLSPDASADATAARVPGARDRGPASARAVIGTQGAG